jgi:protein-glucosylgalactosylhydroxylysine glucosidase
MWDLETFERGYGDFNQEPYGEPDEWSDAMKPDYPRVGALLREPRRRRLACLYGFTGLRPSFASPDTWPQGNVTLPAGWQSIEVDRLTLRGRPHRLIAEQGAPARLEPLA